MKKIIKKPMSLFLLMALLISMFGGIQAGPDAQAAAPRWRINIKTACYDARGCTYAETSHETLYAYEPATLCFKRIQGSRIPKNARLYIFNLSYYNNLIAQESPVINNLNYAKYKGNGQPQSSNTCCWYFKNGFASGTYAVCLFLPYYDENARKTKWTYIWYKVKVYNYG